MIIYIDFYKQLTLRGNTLCVMGMANPGSQAPLLPRQGRLIVELTTLHRKTHQMLRNHKTSLGYGRELDKDWNRKTATNLGHGISEL